MATPREHESKFKVSRASRDTLHLWLLRLCRPDPDYPENYVESIYYDTNDRRHLYEKLNGDRLKTRIRVRWYEEILGGACSEAITEAKLRRGRCRSKLRQPTGISGSRLRQLPLDHPELCELPRLLRPGGVFAGEELAPLLSLRYRRRRFVEPLSGMRLALDTEIGLRRTNSKLLGLGSASQLPDTILEVKGATPELPPTLAWIASALGLRRGGYSKYEACFRSLVPFRVLQ